MTSLCSPYSAILKIADGSSFDEIAQHIECQPSGYSAWTQAIGGVFALLTSEQLVIHRDAKARIRAELEKLDRFIELQAIGPHSFQFSDSIQEPS